MKKIITISVLTILALALAACSASSGSTQSDLSGGSSLSDSGSSGSSNPAPAGGTSQPTGPSALQLAAGMLKLDGTSNAVTAQQATRLLPLWQSLQQMMSTPVAQSTPDGTTTPRPRFDPAMMQQMNSQITLIQNALTPAQLQAITAMNLSRQDIFTIFQQNGIAMGGPGQGGGGFGQNGGTFTPPQGTPQPGGNQGGYQGNGNSGGNPGGFQGNGNGGGSFTGGRRGFGSFLPPSVVDGIVTYLQKKAGS